MGDYIAFIPLKIVIGDNKDASTLVKYIGNALGYQRNPVILSLLQPGTQKLVLPDGVYRPVYKLLQE